MFFKHFFNPSTRRRVYLDYASSTPLDAHMLRTVPSIPPQYAQANPGALHQEGVALKRTLTAARARVAKALGAHADEIIFTSTATESDNLAIAGYITHALQSGVAPESIALYTSPFEHAAISELVETLDKKIRVCELVQEKGYVLPETIAITDDMSVIIVSVLFVQNEIGTTQPIKAIAKQIRMLRKAYPEKTIVFHVDATQAPLYYELFVPRLGVDMLTLGATKLYCPKGVGVLYRRRGIQLAPLLRGGGQEFGLRPGTEPVALIHAFSYALLYAQERYLQSKEATHVLQTYCEERVKEIHPRIRITGEGERSPHISHIVIPAIDSELLVLELDARGIAVSSKSACKNEEPLTSSIVERLYSGENVGAIRVSYGRMTTKRDIDRFIRALQSVLKKYSL